MPPDRDPSDLLKHVIDPDVGVNIVDLGLVLRVAQTDNQVEVDLIMTTPACPQSEHLKAEALRLLTDAGFAATVTVLAAPLWDPSRMSDMARKSLGWAS